ncbi:MAG: hypothetical protein JXX14_13795 [Deltaproteobacteria bacterium]|nr:hypothetical protein [Deltaproteobacteria bacterium]
MHNKLLNRWGIFAAACLVFPCAWTGCQVSTESDIEIVTEEVYPPEYKVELAGDAIAPLIIRNVGCGVESVDVDDSIAVYFSTYNDDDWHKLTDVRTDFSGNSVTGVISPSDRETFLTSGMKYDVRIDLPAESRVIYDGFTFIDDASDSGGDSDSAPRGTDSDSVFDSNMFVDSDSDSGEISSDELPDTGDDSVDSETFVCGESDGCSDSDSGITDSETDSLPDTGDTESMDGTESESDTSTNIDTSSDEQTDTDTATEAETDSEADTDTYTYADGAIYAPVGFAGSSIVDPFNNNPAATTVYVNSAFGLQNAINAQLGGFRPATIYVSGTITGVSEILISNKTNIAIVGDGGSAVFFGTGINISNSSNIIIRDVTIHHVQQGNGDAIGVAGSDHIWIDHCEVYNDQSQFGNYDGLLDITSQSDYITVSWCYFHDNSHGLIAGANDTSFEDAGYFHVTWHHNIFRNIFPGQISMRFGDGHVFNNLFEYDFGNETTGVSSRMGACVRPELNVFDGITRPLDTNQSGDIPPYLGSMDVFTNDYGAVGMGRVTSECTLNLPNDYEYLSVLNGLDGLRALLEEHCGVGKNL